MKMNRVWAMPNKETFTIKPIRELIGKYIESGLWVDPFVRNSVFKSHCFLTNDLSPEFKASSNIEALDFLREIPKNMVDGVLFDPPYSLRQISDCYKGVGREVFQTDTSSRFYASKKDEVARILKQGGVCISFGWNSNGVGKKRGFEVVELLLVNHGSNKNDTIVTVEVKK